MDFKMNFISLAVLLFFQCSVYLIVSASADDCEAAIRNGTVLGTTWSTADPSRNICAFLGIPFAAPPVGELRFRSPKQTDGWGGGVFQATRQPNWCPQDKSSNMPVPPDVVISEDCLQLNVFQPKIEDRRNANFPVMIYFHGGSFSSGSADAYLSSKLLARGDIILVVAQYRLGVLGFLSTGDISSPGNYGLKDMSISIRWVKENIDAFGGNPDKITIFGESAGGAAAMYQLISPMSKGLFHGAIAQSGTALSFWAIDRDPSETASNVARSVGCSSANTETMVECLRQVDWNRFIPISTQPLPVVEIAHENAFLTADPLEVMMSGDIPNIPVIIGANKHDGSFLLAYMYMWELAPRGLDRNPEFMRTQLVPFIMDYIKVQDDKGNRAASSAFEMTYLSGVNRSSWIESMPGLVDLMTASVYKTPALHTAEILRARGSPVFLYSFEHHSENSMWNGVLPTGTPVELGIAHTDDLIYLFELYANLSPDDKRFSDIFCDLWINFATHGNPTPTQDERIMEWLPYDATHQAYMKLNVTPTLLSDYYTSWRPNGFDWN